MPQMYPLSWIVMMPLSIIVMWVYLTMIYYLVSYLKYEMKFGVYMKITSVWEW